VLARLALMLTTNLPTALREAESAEQALALMLSSELAVVSRR
jgi:hypothetical protein